MEYSTDPTQDCLKVQQFHSENASHVYNLSWDPQHRINSEARQHRALTAEPEGWAETGGSLELGDQTSQNGEFHLQ